MAATTIALERGLVTPRREGALRLETGLGPLDVGVTRESPDAAVTRVRCVLPPAFVLAGGMPVALGHRSVPVDVAWGGPFFAIVDSEAAGVPLSRASLTDLRRSARAIAEELMRTLSLTHPLPSGGSGLGAVVFTGPPDGHEAQLRGLAVSPDGFADRAPSGAALAAIVAVLQAMGLATEDAFVMEGLAGTTPGRAPGRRDDGRRSCPRCASRVEGRAWITGEHRWSIDPEDPLADGFDW